MRMAVDPERLPTRRDSRGILHTTDPRPGLVHAIALSGKAFEESASEEVFGLLKRTSAGLPLRRFYEFRVLRQGKIPGHSIAHDPRDADALRFRDALYCRPVCGGNHQGNPLYVTVAGDGLPGSEGFSAHNCAL